MMLPWLFWGNEASVEDWWKKVALEIGKERKVVASVVILISCKI
jgi:hypothetical protein